MIEPLGVFKFEAELDTRPEHALLGYSAYP